MIWIQGFLVSILVTSGQLSLQLGSRHVDFTSVQSMIISMVTNKFLYVAFAIYFVAGTLYLHGLKSYGLNKFFFFLAVSYVSVPIVNSLIETGSVSFKNVATSTMVFIGLFLSVI